MTRWPARWLLYGKRHEAYLRESYARKLARHGAKIRKDKWTAHRNATAAKLCEEMGVKIPEVLRG